MCELFYKLSKHYESLGEPLTKNSKASADSEKPVAVVEPEDVALL
jgi:hypothetical protein